jgi:uncharacterized membrane protein
MILGTAVHILAALTWVGGMLFAHAVLRPATLPLEPAIRLALWRRVLARFFPLVWVAIGALLLSGYAMIFEGFGGFRGAGLHIHLMQGIGLLMMLLFLHLFFAPWRRFQRAVDAADFAAAGRQLGQIRLIVTINLVLGLITIIIGSTGRYWG